MSEPLLTTPQISAQLERGESAAELSAVMRAIASRRVHVNSRLVDLEARNGSTRRIAIASADPAKLAAVNREAEMLTAEVELLDNLDARASQKHGIAQERETMENAKRNLKSLSRLADAGARAYAAYETARRELDDALTTITVARHQVNSDKERAQVEVSDELFERIASVMYAGWPGDSARQPRSALRRRVCAPDTSGLVRTVA